MCRPSAAPQGPAVPFPARGSWAPPPVSTCLPQPVPFTEASRGLRACQPPRPAGVVGAPSHDWLWPARGRRYQTLGRPVKRGGAFPRLAAGPVPASSAVAPRSPGPRVFFRTDPTREQSGSGGAGRRPFSPTLVVVVVSLVKPGGRADEGARRSRAVLGRAHGGGVGERVLCRASSAASDGAPSGLPAEPHPQPRSLVLSPRCTAHPARSVQTLARPGTWGPLFVCRYLDILPFFVL